MEGCMSVRDDGGVGRVSVMRKVLIVAGVFIAVAGFGTTRWVQAELDLTGNDASSARYNLDSWVNGPIDPDEAMISINGFVGRIGGDDRGPKRGVPRRVIAGIGWGAVSVGCAMLALGCVLPRTVTGPSRRAGTAWETDLKGLYSPEE
jgi:hypothetical protein